MEIEKKQRDFRTLSKVVPKTNLKTLFMVSTNVWRSVDALDYDKVEVEIDVRGQLVEDHQDHFLAKAIFSFKGQPEGEEEKEEIVRLYSEYVLVYSLKNRGKLTSADLETFCEMNAVYNAWPYWREFVQTTLNRMELPTFTLPLLKFTQRRNKEAKGEREKS